MFLPDTSGGLGTVGSGVGTPGVREGGMDGSGAGPGDLSGSNSGSLPGSTGSSGISGFISGILAGSGISEGICLLGSISVLSYPSKTHTSLFLLTTELPVAR